MESKRFIVGVFMVLCTVQSSFALQCYNCESVSNPNCADFADTEMRFHTQECVIESLLSVDLGFFSRLGLGGSKVNHGPLIPICVKVVARNVTGRYIARRCAVKYQNEDPCLLARNASPQTGFNAEFEYCGICEVDGCNSGSSMQLLTSVIVFGAMIGTARLLEF